jgi:hypothetical protein
LGKIKENSKTSVEESTGLYELKQYKPQINEKCLRFINHRKQAKMQCLKYPDQSTVDNPYNLRPEAHRHFRTKNKEYQKAKIDYLETNSEIKKITGLYKGFKKGYQPRTNIVKAEKGDLVTDSPSVLGRWRNHFSQLLKVHEVSDVRQTEILTSEQLLPESSVCEFGMAIEKLKRH